MPVSTRSTSQEDLLEFEPEIVRLEREVRRAARIQREIETREAMEVPPNREIGPNGRPIGAFDTPNQREVPLGIPTPTLADGQSIELKSSTLTMIERSPFHGNSVECPLEHLDRFERLVKTLSMRNVPGDKLKMLLFPFSLEDKGRHWEHSIPSSKVGTWDDVKTEFLGKFFPKQKTAKFRNEIQSFQQMGNESLSEAWDRFRGLTRSCPHHGMSKDNLFGIFYRGVDKEIRRALDTASYGSFASLDVDQAERLIDNFAQSDACFGNEYDRSSRRQVASIEPSKSMADLKSELRDELREAMNERIDKMEKSLGNTAKNVPSSTHGPSFYQEPYQGNGFWDQNGNFQCGDQEGNYQGGYGNEGSEKTSEEVNYVGNQGGYNNYKPFNQHPNLSYRNPNVENPQDQSYPQAPNQATNQNHQNRPPFYPNQNQNFNPSQNQPLFSRPQGNFQPKPQGNFNQFQPQSFNQTRPYFFNQQGNYPRGNNFHGANAQGYFEGDHELMRLRAENKAAKDKLDRLLEAQNASSSSKKPITSFPSKPEMNPKSSTNTVLFSDKDGKVDVVDEASLVAEIESFQVATIGESPTALEEKSVENVCTKVMDDLVEILASPRLREAIKTHPLSSILNMDVLKVHKNLERDVQLVSIDENPKALSSAGEEALLDVGKSFKDLGIDLDKGHALNEVHSQLEFAKAILAHKDEVEKVIKDFESPKVKLRTLEKKSSPGMFTIPCSLRGYDFKEAFCDSGSYVSVISTRLVNEMKLEGMQKCKGYVTFGDQSTKRPSGVFKDFPIKVGECIVPTDLLVLDMVDEGNRSLLLGNPFLLTVGARLDYVNRVVSFDYIDKATFYSLGDTPKNLIGTIIQGSPLFTVNGVVENLGSEQPDGPPVCIKKKAKRKRRAKKRKAVVNLITDQEIPKAPTAPSLTLVPIMVVDGKLECEVKTKNRARPFSKAKIILTSTSQGNTEGMLSEKMARLFNIKLGDRGPNSPCRSPPLNH